MNELKIVWNGCDNYKISNDSVFTRSEEFKPFEVVEVEISNLPKDEDGEIEYDCIYGTECGRLFKLAKGGTKMNTQQIAQDFVELHKKFDVAYNGGLDEVYGKLAGGVYGDVHVVERLSGDKELEVEIRGSETLTGNPIEFSWVDEELIDELS